MYPCFSPQWRDLQKIRYLHGQLKLRLTGTDDPFQIHFPASAQIHKPLALAGEEKKKLHVSDLLEKFEQASGGSFANDRMILS